MGYPRFACSSEAARRRCHLLVGASAESIYGRFRKAEGDKEEGLLMLDWPGQEGHAGGTLFIGDDDV